jgi:hypothetical protein
MHIPYPHHPLEARRMTSLSTEIHEVKSKAIDLEALRWSNLLAEDASIELDTSQHDTLRDFRSSKKSSQ